MVDLHENMEKKLNNTLLNTTGLVERVTGQREGEGEREREEREREIGLTSSIKMCLCL